MMKSKVKEFRLGELFCGPGGLAYGAKQAKIADPEYKITHAWANDYDLDTCKTYTRNICRMMQRVLFVAMCENWILRVWEK